MRIRSYSVITTYALALLAAAAQSTPKPTPSPEPLNSEQISIYRAFLTDYLAGPKITLNVAQTTAPFEASDDDLSDCMKTFTKSNAQSTVVHKFSKDALPADTVRFVDPEKHTISAVSYTHLDVYKRQLQPPHPRASCRLALRQTSLHHLHHAQRPG